MPERPNEPWNDLSLPALFERFETTGLVRRLLELARDEDLGPAGLDLTGAALPASEERSTVHLSAREAGVCAGLAAVPLLLEVFGAEIESEPAIDDGAWFEAGTTLAAFSGPLPDLVRVERTLLNLTSRLCGIATRTAVFLDAMGTDPAAGTGCARLYDTRKTTPGLRMLEKYAVRCGGGFCHRLGLHDAVMFKDNHIAGIGPGDLAAHARSLAEQARAAAATAGVRPAFIEFEVDTLDQLGALLTLESGVIDIVLLDNMPPETLREAVSRRDAANPALALEASGGVSLQTIGAIASAGVDRISVGGLTHRAVSLDLGFDAGG
jgi:nicotinate-nucleotide pyrophosphorylase (carboxylating)